MEVWIQPRYAPARLDPATLARVDKWRAGPGCSLSRDEAVRILVLAGLDFFDSGRLDEGDRAVALMLGRLVFGRRPEPEPDPDLVRSATRAGRLEELLAHYRSRGWEVPPTLVKEIVAILEMWTFLEKGFEALSAPERAGVIAEARLSEGKVEFRGFDEKNEEDHRAVAAFLVEEMHLFPRFRDRIDRESYGPRVPSYCRMLAVFEPIRPTLGRAELTAAQIGRILRAGRA